MKTLISTLGLMLSVLSTLSAQILETEIPSVGRIGNTSLNKFLPRIQGWAEGQGHKGFKFIFSEQVPHDLLDKEISIGRYSGKTPTYSMVIKEAFAQAGRTIAIDESESARSIQITMIYARSIRIAQNTRKRFKGPKMNNEKITEEIKSKLPKLSNHFKLNYLKRRGVLHISGVNSDITTVSRFFGQYK